MSSLFRLAVIGLCVFLGSCGGPTQKAKIANFIQTLMSNTIEAFALKESGASTVVFKCGDGSGDEGTFSYSLPAGLNDPLTLIQYISSNGTVANLSVTFSDCVINTCGETITLNGGTATLGMDISTLLQDSAGSGQVPAAFILRVTNQETEGVVASSLSYSYIIEAIYTTDSISSITIKDTDPADPLELDEETYSASDLADLADGC
jgi:hypothetical protein